MVFVKICGIQTREEAAAALESGATALGFLVGLTHRAEDAIDPATAHGIIGEVRASAETALVTHRRDPAAVVQLVASTGASTVQVHGPMTVDDVHRLRSLLPRTRLLKAVHVTGAEAIIEQARAYAGAADALVLDSRSADRLGGTGLTHDWSISARIVAAVAPVPVYLAGGLRPGNVAEAIARVRPAGVDVNSGVEDPTGRKDPIRMRDFVRRARLMLG